MNRIFLFTTLFSSQMLFGQDNICTINGKIEKLESPGIVYMLSGKTITDSTAISGGEFVFIKELGIDDLIFITLKLKYVGETRKSDETHPIFLSPGIVAVIINNPSERKLIMRLGGPKLTTDYEEKLLGPVMASNKSIEENKEKMRAARTLELADTVRYKEKIKEAVALGFDIPRKYINANPTSILSIQALKMMGKGDPTIVNGVDELNILFTSLAENMRNSKAGIAYKTILDKKNSKKNKN